VATGHAAANPSALDAIRDKAAAKAVWARAAGLARFPSFTLAVIGALLPGMTVNGWSLFFARTINRTNVNADAGTMFFYCLTMGAQIGFLLLLPVLSRLSRVKFLRHKHMAFQPLALQLIFPVGSWTPASERRAYGFCFAGARMFRRPGHALPLATAFVCCVIGAIPLQGSTACVGVYAALTCVLYLSAIVMLLRWPYSARASSLLAVASYVCLGTKSLFGLFEASTSRRLHTAAQTGAPIVDFIFFAVALLRAVHMASLVLFDVYLCRRWADRLKKRRAAIEMAKQELHQRSIDAEVQEYEEMKAMRRSHVMVAGASRSLNLVAAAPVNNTIDPSTRGADHNSNGTGASPPLPAAAVPSEMMPVSVDPAGSLPRQHLVAAGSPEAKTASIVKRLQLWTDSDSADTDSDLSPSTFAHAGAQAPVTTAAVSLPRHEVSEAMVLEGPANPLRAVLAAQQAGAGNVSASATMRKASRITLGNLLADTIDTVNSSDPASGGRRERCATQRCSTA
jgi:hypothetical protein